MTGLRSPGATDTDPATRAPAVPKKSWVTLLVGWAYFSLWGVLLTVRAEPNQGLVAHLGYPDYVDLMASDPHLHEYSAVVLRLSGIWYLAFAALVLVVLLGPYRRGERWARNALWILPAANVLGFANDLLGFMRPGEVGTFGPVFLLSALVFSAGLLLGRGAQPMPSRHVTGLNGSGS